MDAVKKNIITQLERTILPLEGIKHLTTDNNISLGIKSIENAFPNKRFPVGCMHEFLSTTNIGNAATHGFVAGLLSKLMYLGGVCMWMSASRTIFPAALKTFGIEPEQIIFIDLKKEKDVLYAMDEALKCDKLISVVGELNEINFKQSRRLQLAVEQSRVTGFILRQPRFVNTIACVSRWRVTSLSSELNNNMPGVGFPRWHIELLKVRNGIPGSWDIEWCGNSFKEVKDNIISLPQTQIRKVS